MYFTDTFTYEIERRIFHVKVRGEYEYGFVDIIEIDIYEEKQLIDKYHEHYSEILDYALTRNYEKD